MGSMNSPVFPHQSISPSHYLDLFETFNINPDNDGFVKSICCKILQNLTIVNRKTVKILFLSLWNEAKGLIHVKVFNKLGAGRPKHSWLAKGQIKKTTIYIYNFWQEFKGKSKKWEHWFCHFIHWPMIKVIEDYCVAWFRM